MECKRCKDKGFVENLESSVHDINGKFKYDKIGLLPCSYKCLMQTGFTNDQILFIVDNMKAKRYKKDLGL